MSAFPPGPACVVVTTDVIGAPGMVCVVPPVTVVVPPMTVVVPPMTVVVPPMTVVVPPMTVGVPPMTVGVPGIVVTSQRTNALAIAWTLTLLLPIRNPKKRETGRDTRTCTLTGMHEGSPGVVGGQTTLASLTRSYQFSVT